MDLASASKRSLSCHLALVACRDGHCNSHLVNELMRAVYLSWYLQRAGYGNQPVEQFKIAESAAEITLAHAHETGEWRLASEVISDFEALLTLYDAQLARAPLHEVVEAERQLSGFLKGTDHSPIPQSTDRQALTDYYSGGALAAGVVAFLIRFSINFVFLIILHN